MSTLERKESKMSLKFEEKVNIKLTDTKEVFHNWTCVTWGEEDGDQTMTEIAVEDFCGIPLDVWVEGYSNGDKIAMRVQDVHKLIITIQGAIERSDLMDFCELLPKSISMYNKLNGDAVFSQDANEGI